MIDHAPGLDRLFTEAPADQTCRPRVEGQIPAFLRGTYYLNGPARFERAGQRYRHWLDGDGMVCALRFDDEGPHLTARYVRGARLTEEEAAGRPIYRSFGTAFPDDRLVRGLALESPLNVSIYPYSGALLAFGEQGLPYELDPHTLETRGPFNFNGGLNPISPFAAHPKIDPRTGELFNFGISFAAAQPSLNLYRFDPQGKLAYRRRLPLDLPASLHDFCLSENYAIFHVGPYLLGMENLAKGSTLLDSLRWQPEHGSCLLIARREDGEPVATIPVGNRYVLHAINAFEQGDRLTVDLVELDRPVYDQYLLETLFEDVAPGRPVRHILDLPTATLLQTQEIAYDRAPDFPAIDPDLAGKPYDHFWMLGISKTGHPGRKFFDQVAHLSWSRPDNPEVWQAPAGRYLGGEPAFAPDPEGEGGAVICQRYDAATGESAFLVFDAYRVGRGPVAVIPLEERVHLGFHATFVTDTERPVPRRSANF